MTKSLEKIIKNFSEDTKQLLKDNLVSEYLFGSAARNENVQLSDIDILIIVKHFDYQLREALSGLSSDYSLEHDLCISPIVKDQTVWENNKIHQTLFYQEIQRDGIQLC
jgi:predicted nucleotidyltransferase